MKEGLCVGVILGGFAVFVMGLFFFVIFTIDPEPYKATLGIVLFLFGSGVLYAGDKTLQAHKECLP